MKTCWSSLVLVVGGLLLVCCEPREYPAKVLPAFSAIQSNGYVTFNLVSGAENRVISTSLADAMYSVSNGVLVVNATGGKMTMSVNSLTRLNCNACSVENDAPLVADTLSMVIHAGSVNLQNITIHGYLGLTAQNTGTYKFSGTVPFFQVSNVNATSVKAFDLLADSVYVSSMNALPTEVNASKVVNVFIMSSGDVYYKGNPDIIRLTNTGSGKLVKK
ncbi:GIN domain-containing protein [Chryseolinea lacunae]|uniref:DUF2807 domain-containing protein n=1 Tax=Chryseolinea lacunae TaxID=2801331 RepID=A0ABS1KLW0_9BACT|nr:DUF2807 domain-containing protein [Chryseolinea lacunae]MBL0740431.1 DUF2807 domain-containing protein [Chryseolinea lacunae]